MSDTKILITWNLVLMLALLGMAFHINTVKKNQGYFAQVPVEEVHTMKVWEDGSFEIVYQDNTSEIGCVTGGLCND